MGNPIKLFIVEGESRDYHFVNEMTACFFKGKYTSTIINLPAAQNLYMLYKKLEEDHFETDVVEVLRDTVDDARIKLDGIKRQDIDEVYLFFDYDVHQDNVLNGSEIILKMLNVFDNETENGKLYISYPMVEALYDYRDGECRVFSHCFIPIEDVGRYKEFSGAGNPKASHKITIQCWKEILNIFYLRIMCLFCEDDVTYLWYRKSVSPITIYQEEQKIGKLCKKVFVLSAFPQFLFDYFKKDFWKSMTQRKKNQRTDCPKT